MRPLAEAFVVVAGEPIGHDLGIQRDLAVGEGFQRAFIVVLGVGETHPAVGLGGHQNELLVG